MRPPARHTSTVVNQNAGLQAASRAASISVDRSPWKHASFHLSHPETTPPSISSLLERKPARSTRPRTTHPPAIRRCPKPQVLGVDPPRPLPAAAYDLQTALESVQHFATQTLAGVVQAAAVRGSDLYDNDFDPLSGARSPRHLAGGGRVGKGSGAKEARDGGVAAGSVEGWEAAWPPRELTAALGLVTARQMAHAMRCDAEPLIQVHSGYGSARGII